MPAVLCTCLGIEGSGHGGFAYRKGVGCRLCRGLQLLAACLIQPCV